MCFHNCIYMPQNYPIRLDPLEQEIAAEISNNAYTLYRQETQVPHGRTYEEYETQPWSNFFAFKIAFFSSL